MSGTESFKNSKNHLQTGISIPWKQKSKKYKIKIEIEGSFWNEGLDNLPIGPLFSLCSVRIVRYPGG
jgi:hypothetical protein